MCLAFTCLLLHIPMIVVGHCNSSNPNIPYILLLEKINNKSLRLSVRNESKSYLVWDTHCVALLKWNVVFDGKSVGIKSRRVDTIDDKHRFFRLPPGSSYTMTINIDELRMGGSSPIYDTQNPRVYRMQYSEDVVNLSSVDKKGLSISASYKVNSYFIDAIQLAYNKNELIKDIYEGEFVSNTISLE